MSTASPPDNRRPTVLVLEDKANWQRTLTEILVEERFDVDAATDLSQAMAKIDQKSYDFVTIDIGLPSSSIIAWEHVAQRIRDRCPNTRTLIVTGAQSSRQRSTRSTITGLMDISRRVASIAPILSAS